MSKETAAEKKATAAEEAVEQEFLAKQVGKETESPEQRNVYEQQMSSTETALVSPDEFHKLKLTS